MNEKPVLTNNIFQDILSGVIQINCSGETKHDGINVSAEGTVNLLMSNKNVGLFEAFSNSVKVSPVLLQSERRKQNEMLIVILIIANPITEQSN